MAKEHNPEIAARGPMARARTRRPAPVYLGHSACAHRVRSQIHAATTTSASVLIVGAPGTNKQRVAEILHHFSAAELSTFEALQPDDPVAFERLEDFVYLSPVEALSITRQAELRERVGLARLVLGTELDPTSDEGRARLYAPLLRWCTTRIELPSLARRPEDIEALALELLLELPSPRPVGALSDGALACLRAYHWPGNEAELEQVLRAALSRCEGVQLELRDLPPRLRIRDARELEGVEDLSLATAERLAIGRAMRQARGNKRLAARLLQIGKTTLYRKLERSKQAEQLP